MNNKNIGLYIHIPFCNSKCPYCDFYSFRADEGLKAKYVEALKEKLRRTEYVFDTVYFGGGTPSSIRTNAISDILRCVKFTDDAEITMECNPSDTGRDSTFFDFDEIREAGVNRISMGLQSAVDSERRALGRISGKAEVERAISRFKNAGIDNISLDLMSGIPRQTHKSLKESIDFCIKSGAKHISSYILKIEDGTLFGKRKDKLMLPDDDTVSDMYLETVELLENNGFRQYEISNFSIPGYESKHNLKYWHCEEYIGMGPAAHSFIGGKRFFYPADINEFIDSGTIADDGNGGDRDEFLMLALRLKEGLNLRMFSKKYDFEISPEFYDYTKRLESNGLLKYSDGIISLTPEGFLVSNSIIFELTERL